MEFLVGGAFFALYKNENNANVKKLKKKKKKGRSGSQTKLFFFSFDPFNKLDEIFGRV